MTLFINMKDINLDEVKKEKRDTTKNGDDKNKSIKKKNKIRCHQCNIKCHMINFKCNDCNNIFCSKHVTRISHKCVKVNENNEKKRKEIEERLPLTVFSKFEKI